MIREAVGPQRLIEVTGNDALTGFTAPKLVWVRDHEPEVWSRVAHVLLPKDYVRLRLTGEYALDKADGAGTILFDLAARDWSPEVLAAPRDRPGLDAADARRAGGHGRRHGRRRGRHRSSGGDAGRRGGRRPVGQRGRRRRRRPGHDGALARDLGRRLRRDRPPHPRAAAASSTPSAMPCRVAGT